MSASFGGNLAGEQDRSFRQIGSIMSAKENDAKVKQLTSARHEAA